MCHSLRLSSSGSGNGEDVWCYLPPSSSKGGEIQVCLSLSPSDCCSQDHMVGGVEEEPLPTRSPASALTAEELRRVGLLPADKSKGREGREGKGRQEVGQQHVSPRVEDNESAADNEMSSVSPPAAPSTLISHPRPPSIPRGRSNLSYTQSSPSPSCSPPFSPITNHQNLTPPLYLLSHPPSFPSPVLNQSNLTLPPNSTTCHLLL